jgi:hypothetical protein
LKKCADRSRHRLRLALLNQSAFVLSFVRGLHTADFGITNALLLGIQYRATAPAPLSRRRPQTASTRSLQYALYFEDFVFDHRSNGLRTRQRLLLQPHRRQNPSRGDYQPGYLFHYHNYYN